MATNKDTRDSMMLVALVVALIATVMVNLLADKKFSRIDLTSEGRYSVSKEFRNILGRLEGPMKITYYVSSRVPTGFEPAKRDILDKLGEIRTAAQGKIELEVKDPSLDIEFKERKYRLLEQREKLKEKMEALKDKPDESKKIQEQIDEIAPKIKELDDQIEVYSKIREKLDQAGFQHRVRSTDKDQVSVQSLYTGLKMTYEDKPEVLLPAIGQSEEIELLLGSKIMELTLKKKPVIAIQAPPAPQQPPVFQQQQRPQGSGFEWLTQGGPDEFKKFEFKPVDLTENNNVPSDAVFLILIRPKELNERQRYEVIKYLAGGGKVFLLASPFKVSHEFGWRVERTPTGLEEYLKELGISYGPDFIADHSNLQQPILDMMRGEIKYDSNPFFVRILEKNINQESPLTRMMPGLLMPNPAEIQPDQEKLKKASLAYTPLATTSKQSWTVLFHDQIDSKKELDYDPETKKFEPGKQVFAMVSGRFPFPYDGKPVPAWPGAPDKDKEAEKDKAVPQTAKVDAKDSTLILCTAPEAFHRMYLEDRNLSQHMRGNYFLLVNLIETFGLAEGGDLMKIRAKRYETRSIDSLVGAEHDSARNWTKLALVLGMPILIILAALTRILIRRQTQTQYEKRFAQTTGPSSFTP